MKVYIIKKIMHSIAYCTYNPIYVFPEKELRSLSPNSYIHVHASVSDLYIPMIGPQNRPIPEIQ